MIEANLNKSTGFIDNPFFRLIAPVFLSFLVYFLVLLVFDTIDQVEINFFRAELILCIIISYLVSETNRFLIFILDKQVPGEENLSKRIVIQVVLSTLLTITVTSGAVAFYMINLVGFKSFSSELIVFNSLYVIFGWCLHAVYFSLVYLKKVADIQLKNEVERRKTIETKMDASLKELKPKLLNKCLETIIALSYKNRDVADEYLGKVSDFYRGKLNRKSQMVSLKDDIEDAVNFVDVYKPWANISLKFEEAFINGISGIQIMHGTISSIIENIVETVIILPDFPAEILLRAKKHFVEIECKANKRLFFSKDTEKELDRLIDSYKLCTEKMIEITNKGGIYFAKIPTE